MSDKNTPNIIRFLLSDRSIENSDIAGTSDGFFLVNKSIASILSTKEVFDFPDSGGERLACSNFFDDWFLYAVPSEEDYTYSLLKLREQEHDTEHGSAADGDTPGVTISFISFSCQRLLDCLADPTDENRKKLNFEINRVVSCKGQCHHKTLKKYFRDPQSHGAYLVANMYTRYIASFAKNGCVAVPEHYKKIVQRSISYNFTIIACIIFVKKDTDISYKVVDILSIVFNVIIIFAVVPVITFLIWLLQITMSGEELIFQVYLCFPAMTAFTIAASIILRRKGFAKSGFFVQFIFPVIFMAQLVVESFIYNFFS